MLHILAAIAGLTMLVACGSSSTSRLDELDRVIARRSQWRAVKEARLDSLRAVLQVVANDDERFRVLGELLQEYIPYDTDSAASVVSRRLALASAMSDPSRQSQARIDDASVLAAMGYCQEALDQLQREKVETLSLQLKRYWMQTNSSVYGYLADNSATAAQREGYTAQSDRWRDSLMASLGPRGAYHPLLEANVELSRHQPEAALQLLEQFMVDNPDVGVRQRAIVAYLMSDCYGQLDNRDQRRDMLIESSICDMQASVREYVSLRQLALMLYEDGDVDRAYRYLSLCLDDARQCNARLRILQASNMFQSVNEVYLATIRRQQRHMMWGILALLVLAAGLVATAMVVYVQKRKVERARHDLDEANISLQEANEKLQATNSAIRESSRLKEEFVAQYMDQCTVFIDRIERLRATVQKLAKTGDKVELAKYAKSLASADDDTKAFYKDFDSTFLRLFPTFVTDFNKLLQPEHVLVPKTPGTLNTELRIFALIRLGITDSAVIARFLRYTVGTIYTYRTRVRSHALGDRDSLETDLMLIGGF